MNTAGKMEGYCAVHVQTGGSFTLARSRCTVFFDLSPPHYETCHQSHNSLPENKKKILLSISKKATVKGSWIAGCILIAASSGHLPGSRRNSIFYCTCRKRSGQLCSSTSGAETSEHGKKVFTAGSKTCDVVLRGAWTWFQKRGALTSENFCFSILFSDFQKCLTEGGLPRTGRFFFFCHPYQPPS